MKSSAGIGSNWYPAVAGFASVGLSLGLMRIAYAPIVPFFITDHWTTTAGAGWIGSANFYGYVAGMILIVPLSRHVQRHRLILGAMWLGVASLAACAWDAGLPWLAASRAIQGLTGAAVVALVPGSVMAASPERRRQLAGGVTIGGIGFAAVPSLLMPWIAPYGPTGEWLVYAALGAGCTVTAWPFIARHMRGRTQQKKTMPRLSGENRRPFVIFLVAYALSGVMITPNALFLSDYLRVDLHASPATAGALFSWFALGLGVGCFGSGVLAHRRGSFAALILLTVVGVAGNTVILLSGSVEVVSVASFFEAIWLGGTISLASLRAFELVGASAHGKYWALLCLAYSGGMLVASSTLAALLSRGVEYMVFFWLVEGLAIVFVVLVVLSYRRVRQPGTP